MDGGSTGQGRAGHKLKGSAFISWVAFLLVSFFALFGFSVYSDILKFLLLLEAEGLVHSCIQTAIHFQPFLTVSSTLTL